VSLAARLGLAIFALTVGVLLALGLGVREAWRIAEERSFEAAFTQGLVPLRDQLTTEVSELPELLEPLCENDPLVDSALVGLGQGDVTPYRLSISVRVPRLAKALRLDELTVVTSTGEIVGSTQEGRVGQLDKELAARVSKAPKIARLRPAAKSPGQQGLAVEASCLKRDTQPSPGQSQPKQASTKLWVGVYAARNLDSLLSRIGKSAGMELSPSRRFLALIACSTRSSSPSRVAFPSPRHARGVPYYRPSTSWISPCS